MNETYELNDRTYIEPTVSRDEQLNFVNNLRATQQADLSKINRDTHALGTNVPMNLGGLGGAEGVFNRRYVAPQTNALVSELKAKAQASALNTALTNLQNQYQNEYQQAYRRAAKRAKTTGGGNGGNGGGSTLEDLINSIINNIQNPEEVKNTTGNLNRLFGGNSSNNSSSSSSSSSSSGTSLYKNPKDAAAGITGGLRSW